MISGVLSNCSFRDRKISANYRKPFDILVENMTAADGADVGKAAGIGGSPKWQTFVDDIRTCLWEEADDVAARVLSLQLIGALPPSSNRSRMPALKAANSSSS
jgi:hypothetical protein